MTASAAPALQEYRALLVYDALPAGCIAVPVTKPDLAPHLRPGEFAIIDPSDREPVHGELFVVAWMGCADPDGREMTALCQAHRRSHVCDGETYEAWSVGSFRVPRTREEVSRMVREGRTAGLGWSNGPYHDGVLERQLRGRVVGILAPAFEEPKRLPAARGGAL